MVGAARVESCSTLGACVAAGQVLRDAQRVAAIAAENGCGAALGFAPNNRGVVSGFIVALDAGVKAIAALESNGDKVKLGVVMGALGALVHADAIAGDGRWGPHGG